MQLLVIVELVLVNGLLAGSEIAIVSVRTTRLAELARAGRRGARAALRLRGALEPFLATVQVGITVVGAAAGAFGGTAFAADLEPAVAAVPGLAPYARGVAFALVVVVVSYLSVVLGELVPKSLALRSSERYALLAAPPLLVLSRVARPVVWFLTGSSNLVLAAFGDRTSFTESRVSLDEIRHLVTEATAEEGIEARKGEIVTRALDFANLTAEDVMVPMRHLVAIPATASVEEARRSLRESGQDRLAVVDAAGEGIAGYVTWREVFAEEGATGDTGAAVGARARPTCFVPEVMPAVEVLRELQEKRTRVAAVVDEHGRTVGVVFRSDLLAEIVGEFVGEYEATPPGRIQPDPGGGKVLDGVVSLRAANRALGIALDGEGRCRTVGGLCAQLAGGRIPAVGEELVANDGTILVPVDVSPRRVRAVAVRPAPAPAGEGESDAP